MKNITSSSNFTYSGSVEIITKTRTHVQKNNGTPALFQLFNRVLTTNPVFTKEETIKYIDIRKSSSPDKPDKPDKWESILREKCTTSYWYDDDFENVIISTVVDANSLRSDAPVDSAGVTFNLFLCIERGDKTLIDLAYTEFGENDYNTIRNGGQCVINWTMGVGNPN